MTRFIIKVLFGLLSLQSHATEPMTLYPPSGRLGFTNTPVTVCLSNINHGPSDAHFVIEDPLTRQLPVPKGSMTFTQSGKSVLITADKSYMLSSELSNHLKLNISAFATARLTYDAQARIINSLLECQNFKKLKLRLNPHDKFCSEGANNAYYQPGKGQGQQDNIQFCDTGFSTARFFDVVCHEVGHAILDALRPDFLSTPNSAAFHEAFSDLSAIFTSLYLARLEGKIFSIDAFLRQPFPVKIAQGWPELGHVRLITATPTISGKPHHDSMVFTSFFLNTMSSAFTKIANPSQQAGHLIDYYHSLLILAINRAEASTMDSIARNIVTQIAQDEECLKQLVVSKYLLNQDRFYPPLLSNHLREISQIYWSSMDAPITLWELRMCRDLLSRLRVSVDQNYLRYF